MRTTSTYDLFLGYADPESQKEQPHTYHVANGGPFGRVDSYQWDAVVDEDAWYTFSLSAANKPKKIIFSDPLMNLRAKAPEEFELWDELTQKHAVYVWKGDHDPLTSQTPSANFREFSKALAELVSQSEDEIRKSLAAQGLELKDFIIIDIYKYYEFLYSILPKNGAKKRIPDYHLLLSPRNENFDKPQVLKNLKNHDPTFVEKAQQFSKKFSTLVIQGPASLKEIEKQFSESTSVKNLDLYAKWGLIHSCLSKEVFQGLETLKIGIVQESYETENFRLPELEVKFLNIQIPEKPCSFDLSHLRSCKDLTLQNRALFERNLLLPSQLESLEIEIEFLKFINDDLKKNLKNLKIFSVQKNVKYSINLDQYRLETLSIKMDENDLKIENLPDTLKEINISAKDIDLKSSDNLKNLESLEVIWGEYFNFEQAVFPRLKKLKLTHPDSKDAYGFLGEAVICDELDFPMCPNLEDLDLFRFTSLQKIIDIPKSLKKLRLQDCSRLESLNLEGLTQLEALSLQGLKILEPIKILPGSLKFVSLGNSPNLRNIDLSGIKILHRFESFNMPLVNFKLPPIVHHIYVHKTNSKKFFDFSKIDKCYSLTIEQNGKEGLSKIIFPKKIQDFKFDGECEIEISSLKGTEISNVDTEKSILLRLGADRIYLLEKLLFKKLLFSPEKFEELKFSKEISSLVLSFLESMRSKLREMEGLSYKSLIFSKDPLKVFLILDPHQTAKLSVHLEGLNRVLKNMLSRIFVKNSLKATEFLTTDLENYELLLECEEPEFNRSANTLNQAHPTALLDLGVDEINPDANTGGLTPQLDYSGRSMKVTCYREDAKVDVHHYRAAIYDQIILESNDLKFKPSYESLTEIKVKAFPHEENKTLSEIRAHVDKAKGSLVSFYIELTLKPNILVPLTSASDLKERDISSLYSNDESLIWHKSDTQQIFFQLPDGSPEKTIKIAYAHKHRLDYLLKNPINEKTNFHLKKNLISQDLRGKLDEVIHENAELQFLKDAKLSLEIKLQKLKIYCSSFTEKDSNSKKNSSSFDAIFNNLVNKSGVCRHRSECFMLIAHYLNVPAIMIRNQSHRYVEIPIKENGEIKYFAIDLGGGNYDDLTPEEERINPFEQDKKTDEKKQEDELAQKSEIENIRRELPKRINNIFSKIHVFSSVMDCLGPDAPRSPLLMLSQGMDPIEINAAILNELSPLPAHLYIHSPADFTRYLRARKFENGRRKKIQGPLKDLIEKGGVLVINWNNFNATQKASYKSLLEENPTFKGEKVSPNLKVISLYSTNSPKACESFSTRTSLYILESNYFNKNFPRAEHSNQQPLEIELFGLPNWRERLLGEVLRKGKNIYLTEGMLIQAIKQKRPLLVNNLPDDPELKALLRRAETEGKIFYNGEMLAISPDFYVLSREKENAISAKNVKVVKASKDQTTPGIILNANNIHECIKRLVIDNKTHTADSNAPGWLNDFQHFYISDYISKGQWQELISKASALSGKDFTFSLLPGAEIEGLLKSDAPILINQNSSLVFTNDPDFYCLQQETLADSTKKPLIIDITPKTTYQSLIANLLEKEDSEDNIEYTYEIQGMLEQLINGRDVILNGEISPILYQQLLPFLKPEIAITYLNGERVLAKGKLSLVMPASAKIGINPGEYAEKTYTLKDYREQFLEKDQDKITKLEYLFNVANELPHVGLGQPALPTFTQAYLVHLLEVLNKPKNERLHLSNPIKGLFHYDYSKNSQNYAVLNVLAKALFAPEGQPNKSRSQKLKSFNINTLQDVQKNSWKILNACNVSVIRQILGDLKEGPIKISNGQAILSNEKISFLFNYVMKELDELPKKKNPEKSLNQVQGLLRDTKSRAIVLKGMPGSRKTFSIRQLKKELPEGHYHKGTHHIFDWVNTIPKFHKPIILHLDEANMEEPSTWDMFKGLFRNESSIYYQDKEFKLSDQHKVVFTGNDETLPGRHFHRFFQHYAETIHFSMPLDEWINATFIKPVLTELKIPDHKMSENLLWAFHHVKDYYPHFVISLRDMENLVNRLKYISDSEKDINTLVFKACCFEFACGIPDLKSRKQFIEALRSQIKPKPDKDKEDAADHVIQIGDISIPESKKFILEVLEQDLLCGSRKGILLEGNSGVGKSSLCKALLEKHGFTYYEITVDNSSTIPETLIKAYLQGAKVVLDELNLNPKVETLLNDLLEGILPADKEFVEMIKMIAGSENPEVVPGFQAFISQNGGEMDGRNPSSGAIRNRCHEIYFDAYTREDLVSIHAFNKILRPEVVVDQFFDEAQKKPGFTNTRKLFAWMKKVKDHKHSDALTDFTQFDFLAQKMFQIRGENKWNSRELDWLNAIEKLTKNCYQSYASGTSGELCTIILKAELENILIAISKESKSFSVRQLFMKSQSSMHFLTTISKLMSDSSDESLKSGSIISQIKI